MCYPHERRPQIIEVGHEHTGGMKVRRILSKCVVFNVGFSRILIKEGCFLSKQYITEILNAVILDKLEVNLIIM